MVELLNDKTKKPRYMLNKIKENIVFCIIRNWSYQM